MANTPGKVSAILRDMIQLIEAGEWGKSGIIPSRTTLAKKYKVATSTINDVFTLLHAHGYVLPIGRNIMVNRHRIALPVLVSSFDRYLKDLNITPYMRNLSEPEIMELSGPLAEVFDLPIGMKVVRRLRIQGELQDQQYIPYRMTETFYPADLAGHYLEAIKQESAFVLIDAIKADTGKVISRSHIEAITRMPTEQEMQLLLITLQTDVNELFRKSFAEDGTLIMFSRIVSPSHRFKIVIDAATPL